MKIYIYMMASFIRSNGFTSIGAQIKVTENDLAGIPEGHKRLILNEVSPCVNDRSLSSPYPQRKVQLLNLG